MKSLFIFLFVFFIAVANAQQKDSVFILKCVLSGDSEALPYCPVTLSQTGLYKQWNADSSGILVIDAKGISSAALIHATYPQHLTLEMKANALHLDDTTYLLISNASVDMGEYIILYYREPVPGKKKPRAVPVPVYSTDTLARVDLYREWIPVTHDSLSLKPLENFGEFASYISKTIHYPKKAYENNIQGKIYFDFQLDRSGKITQLKLTGGSDPALILETARFLESMPALRFERPVSIPVVVREQILETNKTEWVEYKPARTVIYSICINYELR